MPSIRRKSDLQTIANRLHLEQQHKVLLRRFAEIDKQLPASATYFVSPTPSETRTIDVVRKSTGVCTHGQFLWERCGKCGRTTKDAQEKLGKILQ